MNKSKPSQAVATYQRSVLVGTSPANVLKELRRRSLAGDIASAGPSVMPITRGPDIGRYGIPVTLRIVAKPAPASWSWKRVAAGAALGGVPLAAGWHAVMTLGFWPFAIFLALTLAAFLLALARLKFSRSWSRDEASGSATTTTKVMWG
jgi:hypothetical protein